VDGDGGVHIVYSGTDSYCGLKYAYYNGAEWVTEGVFEDEGNGYYNSLGLDRDGRPHVSLGGDDLVYAYRDAGKWEVRTVAPGGEAEKYAFTSIALDGQGRPHISYFCDFYEPGEYDLKRVELRYSYWTGDAWDTSTIDPDGGGTWYKSVSLALDKEAKPHVCYQGHISCFDEMGGNLKYARQEEGRWVVETVDEAGWTGLSTSIALDAEGRPLISYYASVPYFGGQSGRYVFKVARWTGEDWAISTIDSADCGFYDQAPWKTSIAAGPSGQPHISYYGFNSRGLKYATWRGPGLFPPDETSDDLCRKGRTASPRRWPFTRNRTRRRKYTTTSPAV